MFATFDVDFLSDETRGVVTIHTPRGKVQIEVEATSDPEFARWTVPIDRELAARNLARVPGFRAPELGLDGNYEFNVVDNPARTNT